MVEKFVVYYPIEFLRCLVSISLPANIVCRAEIPVRAPNPWHPHLIQSSTIPLLEGL